MIVVYQFELFDFEIFLGVCSQRIPTQYVFAKECNRNVHKQSNDGH